MLLQAGLENLPHDVPSYLTAAVGPPTTASSREFCSVCGNLAGYVPATSCLLQPTHNV